MVSDPIRNLAYVVDRTNAKLLAVDTTLGRTVTHTPVGGAATSVTVSPAGDRIYVAEPGAFQIEMFSLPDLNRIGHISPAITPQSIASDSRGRLYAAYNGLIHQIDADSGAVLATAPTGVWYAPLLRTNAAGTRLYIRELALSSSSGVCEEYDLTGLGTPQRIATYTIPMANGKDLAIDTAARHIYTADGGVYGVGVTSMDTNTNGVWPFVSAAYGAGVATREGSASVFGVSSDPYGGGVFEFEKSTGLIKGIYTSTYTAMTGTVVVTPNDHVLCGTAYWTGTNAGYRYRMMAVGPGSLIVDDVPVARFSTSSDEPGLFSFDASASNAYKPTQAITGYAWDFGDGKTATGVVAGHRFTAVGVYTVTLTVTSSTGLVDDHSFAITVTDVSGPTVIDRIEALAGVYRAGDSLAFTVVTNRAVTVTGGRPPSFDVMVGNRVRAAVLADGSGTNRLRFMLPVTKGDVDLDGVTLRGAIRLPSGTTITGPEGAVLPATSLPTPAGVVVDTRPTFAMSVTGPSPGAYSTGQSLLFKVQFSENVVVTGTPYLTVTIGQTTRQATAIGHVDAAANEIWFRYTVRRGDQSRSGITLGRMLVLPPGAAVLNPRGEPVRLTIWTLRAFGSGVTVNRLARAAR